MNEKSTGQSSSSNTTHVARQFMSDWASGKDISNKVSKQPSGLGGDPNRKFQRPMGTINPTKFFTEGNECIALDETTDTIYRLKINSAGLVDDLKIYKKTA